MKKQKNKKTTSSKKYDKYQDNIARILFILILCIQPVFLTPDRYIGLTGQKFWFFFVYMCLILLYVSLIWIARLMHGGMRSPDFKMLTAADWAIIAFAFVTLISALFSPFRDVTNVWLGITEPGGRYDGAITQLLYAAVFFIISRWYKPQDNDLMWLSVSVIVVTMIGVLQFFGMDFLRLWPNHMVEYRVDNFYHIYFRTTLGNTNIVSAYVCVAVLLCGFLFIKFENKWRYLSLAASALSFWLMLISASFSGMIGVAGAVLLMLPLLMQDRKVFGRFLLLGASWSLAYLLQFLFYDVIVLGTDIMSVFIAFALAALLIASGIVLERGIVFPEFWKIKSPGSTGGWKTGTITFIICIVIGVACIEVLGARAADTGGGVIYELRGVLHGQIDDTFGTNRVYIWRNALSIAPENLLIGTGPDTFGHAFPSDAQQFFGDFYDKAHNEYLQILICQGVLGLLFYLVFLVDVFRKSIIGAFRNEWVAVALVAFTGYLIQAFFNISQPITGPFLFVIAGLLMNEKVRNMPRGGH